jgi:tRNA (guanosine-2'-O-)-methyltransferase
VRRSTPTAFEPNCNDVEAPPWDEAWTARGIIEVLEPLALERRAEKFRRVIADRIESVTVVMDAPHDPHNGAAILRSCEAFGVQTLHVVERIEPFLIARKVSKGTERWLDVIRHKDVDSALTRLTRERYKLVVAHPEGEFLPEELAEFERIALVMGNESDGVCAELTRAAHHTVRVPMRGFVESLNVSVTTALLLAAVTRNRSGDLSEERQTYLYARSLQRSVPRSLAVLANLTPR